MEVIHTVQTYTANIYCGLRAGYGKRLYKTAEAYKIIKQYCDKSSFAVTFTETSFIYKDGDEPGIIIGLINYPRFPSSKQQIKQRAKYIALMLKQEFKQERVSIIFPDETIMFGEK